MSSFTHASRLDGKQVHTTLSGVMTEPDAIAAIREFDAYVPVDSFFEFHVHLGGLERYEAKAREAWTSALRRRKKMCKRVVIYGAKPLIRMAAATVAMVIGLPMDFVEEPS